MSIDISHRLLIGAVGTIAKLAKVCILRISKQKLYFILLNIFMYLYFANLCLSIDIYKGVVGTIAKLAKVCILRISKQKLYFILTERVVNGSVSIWCELPQVRDKGQLK